MLWNLVESSEIVLFCIVFYGRPSGWSNTIYVCSAQSENRYNSGIVLRKVRILPLSGEVGILTMRRANSGIAPVQSGYRDKVRK